MFSAKLRTYLVYLDDVIVFSSSRKAHLHHVHEDIPLLEKDCLSLKLAKCHFLQASMDYLGHVIRP
jgi:Reverse transcriptase (RNA-dependent DNA polymerase)